MVIFQTPDGNPGYNQFETVDEAVQFVEKLRNEQDVENARMFALEEVKFEFKAYYKVELPMLNRASAPAAPSAQVAAPAAPAAPPAPPAPPESAPAPAFGAASDDADSPVGASASAGRLDDMASFGGTQTPSPTFLSAAPPVNGGADAAPNGDAPSRRGLFGR